IDSARKVEGIARHSSTHAAGVVISRDPLVEHVPLQRAGGKSEGEVTTQYPMSRLEELGLLKMDFLGLSTLTILGKAVELARHKKPDLTLENMPLDDPKCYELLRRGETVGVFQLEGGMTTRMTIDVAPNCFEDLIALMALIRPGPMEMAPDYISRKHGRTPIAYMHPEMESILSETYGIALYQEQVMQIANVLAGFSMAEGDGLRKAMGKKLPEEMAKYRGRFIEGCVAHGLTKELAGEIFDMIERFAGYGFNKAHSAAYAVIAAQTAYLKANFPVEFMAALLSTEIGNTDKIVVNVVECRRQGIDLLPPDVNASDWEFSVEHAADGREVVRFGLGAIKNVGEGAVRAILSARADQPAGRFADLETFCEAVDWSSVNKRVAECLAKCGAMDCFGPRSWVIGALDAAVAAGQQRQKASARGQMGLFDLGGAAAAAAKPRLVTGEPEIARRQLLAWEKELTGIYLSEHPLSEVLETSLNDGITQIVALAERPTGDKVRVIGMINGVRRITTKTNRTMAVIDLEDLTGNIELVAFPDCYEQHAELWEPDLIVEVTAKVDRRSEQLQLICETASTEIKQAPRRKPRRAVHVCLPVSRNVEQDIRLMQDVFEILTHFEGDDEFVISVPTSRGQVALRSRSRGVEWNDSLQDALKRVLGPHAVELRVPMLASDPTRRFVELAEAAQTS
ncbi:MAG TPA: DNA polymerase III subunit alpha, partial [Thermomicrobiales bacterium]|nr:DNA polymerase III subunit alpha [Thermomicrobiales bacterium]